MTRIFRLMLADVISEKVKALIVTGDTAEKIAAAVKSSIFYRPEKLPVIFAADLETAVLEAKNFKQGEILFCFLRMLIFRQI